VVESLSLQIGLVFAPGKLYILQREGNQSKKRIYLAEISSRSYN